ncbi:MAG: MarR family transcriptional regulator [Peptostreptococcaceae bacterium]
MEQYLKDLNLIDLISEKHARLRKMVRDTWKEQGEDEVTDTETYMLAIIEREKTTVANAARIIGISRQGAHKCVKSLIDRGYVLIENNDTKSRDKALVLTEKGSRFCKESLMIKLKLEESIKESLGEDSFEILKKCLNEKWFK